MSKFPKKEKTRGLTQQNYFDMLDIKNPSCIFRRLENIRDELNSFDTYENEISKSIDSFSGQILMINEQKINENVSINIDTNQRDLIHTIVNEYKSNNIELIKEILAQKEQNSISIDEKSVEIIKKIEELLEKLDEIKKSLDAILNRTSYNNNNFKITNYTKNTYKNPESTFMKRYNEFNSEITDYKNYLDNLNSKYSNAVYMFQLDCINYIKSIKYNTLINVITFYIDICNKIKDKIDNLSSNQFFDTLYNNKITEYLIKFKKYLNILDFFINNDYIKTINFINININSFNNINNISKINSIYKNNYYSTKYKLLQENIENIKKIFNDMLNLKKIDLKLSIKESSNKIIHLKEKLTEIIKFSTFFLGNALKITNQNFNNSLKKITNNLNIAHRNLVNTELNKLKFSKFRPGNKVTIIVPGNDNLNKRLSGIILTNNIINGKIPVNVNGEIMYIQPDKIFNPSNESLSNVQSSSVSPSNELLSNVPFSGYVPIQSEQVISQSNQGETNNTLLNTNESEKAKRQTPVTVKENTQQSVKNNNPKVGNNVQFRRKTNGSILYGKVRKIYNSDGKRFADIINTQNKNKKNFGSMKIEYEKLEKRIP
jgi:hypothetical protein